jgi:hypothetical protein
MRFGSRPFMLCYDSVWTMFDRRQYILPILPLSVSEKEKLGKPKEEIGNLKMDLNICILMISKYNICKLNIRSLVILRNNISNLNILHIHISYFREHDILPLHGKTRSAIDEQTETGPKKTPPTTHLNVRWRKKGSEVKSENHNTTHAKSYLHKGMWNGSTIWQNSAYVDAFSNPFTQ